MIVNYETILYEKKGSIAVVTLNRPERLNAINLQMNRDLVDALDAAKEDNEVRAVIITGAGRAFCAGLMLENLLAENSVRVIKKENQNIFIHITYIN